MTMNVSKLNLSGVEYNLTDEDAQSKITAINEALNDYETVAGAASKYQPKGEYLTEHQSLDNYYTKKQVDDAIDAIPSYDNTALKERVASLEAIDHSQYLTEHQDISNLATKADVTDAVPTKVSELINDSEYQTKSEVNAAIQKVVGAAPEALDTLEEIATKLSSNDDAVASIVNTLSEKANAAEYYKKSEVDTKIADAVETIDLTPYETIEGAAEKYQPKGNYLTEHQDISGKADKSEIPSLAGYATESWVEGKGYLTEHQSLADYVKKAAFAVNEETETLEITFN